MIRIVFGWNHFKIKSIDPFLLGLAQSPNSGLKIELLQKYFHIFWIPFFALGKTWALRKDGKHYKLPTEALAVLRTREDLQGKTPWYTFAGLILIAGAMLIYNINEKVSRYKWKQSDNKYFAAAATANLEKFRKPTPYDYYVMVHGEGYSETYARVTGLDKHNIQLSYIDDPNQYASTPVEIADLFLKNENNLKTVTISRSDSDKVICRDNDQAASFGGITMQVRGQSQTFRIKKIVRVDGPVLISGTESVNYSSHEFRASIANHGLATSITKIEPLTGSIDPMLAIKMPISLEPNKGFILYGRSDSTNQFKAKITCAGVNGEELAFMLDGMGSNQTLTRL